MISKQPFGVLDDGREVRLFTLKNSNGIEVAITNYGGIITSIKTPDKQGNRDNIVLGFDDIKKYQEDNFYLGALIGRFGNRIAGGKTTVNGRPVILSKNDGDNHLHGGIEGFNRKLWSVEDDKTELTLSLYSKAGDEGYPGNVQVTARYRLDDENKLTIEFSAETDRATPLNLTAHSYFNLSGSPANTILNHELKVLADAYLPVNENLIPTGEIRPVKGTPFDFRDFKAVGRDYDETSGGYDHNFVLKEYDGELKPAAMLKDPSSGRAMNLYTSMPGLQFYSGNFLDGSVSSPDGVPFKKHSALCLEPQFFPDSPNQPQFPSTILKPGELHKSWIVYEFLA